jgi:glycosyltransferase involved in cell wall biosynthesis
MLITNADAARDQRNWAGAEELYAKALKFDGSLAHIWVQYGHALKEQRKLSEAGIAYERALAGDQNNDDTYLQIGHLKKIQGNLSEAKLWYEKALALNQRSEAKSELVALGVSPNRLRRLFSKASSGGAAGFSLALELSDLIDFLCRARYPTGIQRVQLAIAEGYATRGEDVYFVYFDHGRNVWTEISKNDVQAIIGLVADSGLSDSIRQAQAEKVRNTQLTSPEFEFSPGCFLVNLGTSWGYLNQFLAIREAKQKYAIKYVPFVHDCIPILYPEFCNPNLVQDFINWINGICEHADVILANSQNTRNDLETVGKKLGYELPECHVVRLNGTFGSGASEEAEHDPDALKVLRDNNLDVEDFALIVSTIEPRKNHALVLSAWTRLIKSKPAGQVPYLVCVGNSGWMNDDFRQRLERDKALHQRVIVLTNVSDQTLELLYRRCLFTIFPSLYEGWGLPISEAIAQGKVPLVSNVSSHPEAGGDVAVYFDLQSEADFQSKLDMLIYDPQSRKTLEQKLLSTKVLRPWYEIGADVIGVLQRWNADTSRRSAEKPRDFKSPAPIASGTYYSFGRNTAFSLSDVTHSADKFREGTGWHSPEQWGCWLRERSADLTFDLSNEPSNEFLLYLYLTALPHTDTEVTIMIPTVGWQKHLTIPKSCDHWERVEFKFAPGSTKHIRIRLASDQIEDFHQSSDGVDSRKATLGIKGVFACSKSNNLQRTAVIEAIQLGDLRSMGYRFPRVPTL